MSSPFARKSASPQGRVLAVVLVSVLAVILLAGSWGPASGAAASGFENVQVFIQTAQDHPYSYTLTAYNTSGFQVAYYQSNFPAAALELPAGTYLFTVSATYAYSGYPCPEVCSGSSTQTTATTSSSSTESAYGSPASTETVTNDISSTVSQGGASSTPALPAILVSSAEYGYAVEQITGPSIVTISTQNVSALPTTHVTVHVSYANGTAVQGAWVYASVIDGYYFYMPSVVPSAQTGPDGNAVLTMPIAPLVVTSYLWTPVLPTPVPSNGTTTGTGQKGNVTDTVDQVQETLEGQVIVIPPQTSCSIVLRAQTSEYYYPLPAGGLSNGSPGATTTTTYSTTATATTTGQATTEVRLPAFNPTNVQQAQLVSSPAVTTTVAQGGLARESLLQVGGVVAVAVTLAVLTMMLTTGKRREPRAVPA